MRALVNNDSVAQFSRGSTSMDDIVVLHLENGKDLFVRGAGWRPRGGVIAGVVFVGTDSGPTRAADGQLLQISVSGEFLLTCFGLPLETLCSMPHPARSDEVRR